MPTIAIDVDPVTLAFLIDRHRVHNSVNRHKTFSDFVGQYVDNLVDEIKGEMK